jgi:nicotinate-nucleotide pyrophosphorylase (carboxylating)
MPRTTRRARSTAGSRSLDALLDRMLAEDRYVDDLTSSTIVPVGATVRAMAVAQAPGILSGCGAAALLAKRAGVRVRSAARDGSAVRPGSVVLELTGEARAVLGIERPLLNLLMHLSGVATATREAVERAGGRIEVRGTRKTVPGLRELEKAALRHGGANPHRSDLADGILVKNNHLALVDLEAAIARLRARPRPRPRIEVEVRSKEEALRALRAGAEELLIDNATPAQARTIVTAVRGAPGGAHLPIELSGGITASNLARYRSTGADAVSLGSLTHSAPALPFHLTVAPVRRSESR